MIKLLKYHRENKKYLIVNFHKLNYPIGSELIFIDEFLFNLYKAEDKLAYKCSFIYSLNDIIKIYNSIDIIVKKKLVIYRKEFKIFLNIYHNNNNSKKFWGIITDQFLIVLLKSIILEIKLYQKIKVKNFHMIHETIKEKTIFSLITFLTYQSSNDFKKLLSSTVLKELNNNFVNLKYKSIDKIINKNKTKIYILILRPLIRLYIYLFKPILIIDGYIGLKNTFFFLLRSFGKIINIPSNLLFNETCNNSFIDHNFRQRIKIQEKDIIDKIFNKIIGMLLPTSYLENFNSIKKDIEKISKKIKTIGTGNNHYCNDHFNILTALILKNKNRKLVIFQHGGAISKTNNLIFEYFNQKYSFRKYYFDNPQGLGMHFFNEKISFEEIKKRNFILILNTLIYLDEFKFEKNSNNNSSRNINLDPSLVFFSNLKESNKKKVLLKLFPEKNSFLVKKHWEKNFGNKITFLPFFSNAKKKNFYKAKLVILNDISTSLWELLFFGLPFILICNQTVLESWQYKNSFKKRFFKLKKINVWFNDPAKAAHFVNSLDKDYLIEEWWKKISKTKIFLDFKNFLIVQKKNYHSRIVRDLMNLNK